MNKKFKIVVGVISLTIFLVLIFRASLLTAYAELFEVNNAKKGAGAIICLSGGKQTRIPKTIELWNQGYAPKVFLTDERKINRDYSHLEISNTEFAKEVSKIMKLDVPWGIIPSKDGGATSTFDEAFDALSFAKENDWKRIIIVTDNFHTRRALHAFKKVFQGSGIEIQASGAANDIFSSENWWKSDRGILSYFSETIKFPIYFFWSTEPDLVANH